MSSINVDDDTKERFSALQPDDTTQDEFATILLDSFEQNGAGVDPDEWADRVSEQVAAVVANKVELGAFRGVKDYLETHE